MTLESSVARILINRMPDSIKKRMMDREDISTLCASPRISYRNIGSFDFNAVADAIETSKNSNELASIKSLEGVVYSLTRASNGIYIKPSENADSKSFRIPELSFLDPYPEVRIEALGLLRSNCSPALLCEPKWNSLLQNRRPTELEFSKLIDDIQNTPSQFIKGLEGKIKSQSDVGFEDFFPTSFGYYDALVPAPPINTPVEEWTRNFLIPKLTDGVSNSTAVDLKWALCAGIDARLPIVDIVKNIPLPTLMEQLRALVNCRSPFIIKAVFEIAVANVSNDAACLDIASEALDHLIGEKSKKIDMPNTIQVLLSSAKACFQIISSDDVMSGLPPYWRRAAALAHANLLLDLLKVENLNLEIFIPGLKQFQTHETAAKALVDFCEEPLWDFDRMTVEVLSAQIIGHLALINEKILDKGFKLLNEELLIDALEDLNSDAQILNAYRPGPLNDGQRIRGKKDAEKAESSPEIFSELLIEIQQEPLSNAWIALANVSRQFEFDQNLLNSLSSCLINVSLPDENREIYFEILAGGAQIAATQPFELLAEKVADCVIQGASKFKSSREAEMGYYILMMSSGAIVAPNDWKIWVDARMSDYALLLPKGEACQQLLKNLSVLQKHLPLATRPFARARKFASSSI